MPSSVNDMIRVSVINPCLNRKFPEIITHNNSCFICVENNQDFKIEMIVQDEYIDKVYGCKLYLDGKLIKGKKTLKRRGYYQGFKQGGGCFKQFLFSIPPQAEAEYAKNTLNILHKEEVKMASKGKLNSFCVKEYLGSEYFGTIHIEFYNTK